MKTYLEFHDSDKDSAKFWEIQGKGSSHTVRFGKLGVQGQSKTKAFSSAALAHADAEKLIASKRKKGYEEAAVGKKRATAKKKVAKKSAAAKKKAGAKKTSTSRARSTGGELQDVLAEIEKFLERLKQSGLFEVSRSKPLKPASASAVKAIEKAYGQPVPEQLLEFWKTGFRNISIYPAEDSGLPETGGATDFVDAAYVKEYAEMYAESEQVFQESRDDSRSHEDPEEFRRTIECDEFWRLQARGLSITPDIPVIVVELDPLGEPGSIHMNDTKFGFRVPLEPIAPDLATFLRHYAAAGFFFSGGDAKAMDVYWSAIKDHSPFDIKREENLWLLHLDRYYKPGHAKSRKKYKPCPLPRWALELPAPAFPEILSKLNEEPAVLNRLAQGGTFLEIFPGWKPLDSPHDQEYVFFGESHGGAVGMRRDGRRNPEEREILYLDSEDMEPRRCASSLKEFLVKTAEGRSAYSLVNRIENEIAEPVPELIAWMAQNNLSLPSALKKEMQRAAPAELVEPLRKLARIASGLEVYPKTRAMPWDALPDKKLKQGSLVIIGELEYGGYIALHKLKKDLLGACPILCIPSDPEIKLEDSRVANSLLDFMEMLKKDRSAIDLIIKGKGR